MSRIFIELAQFRQCILMKMRLTVLEFISIFLIIDLKCCMRMLSQIQTMLTQVQLYTDKRTSNKIYLEEEF